MASCGPSGTCGANPKRLGLGGLLSLLSVAPSTMRGRTQRPNTTLQETAAALFVLRVSSASNAAAVAELCRSVEEMPPQRVPFHRRSIVDREFSDPSNWY